MSSKNRVEEKKPAHAKSKVFSLTADEVSNLAGRREIARFWEYSAKIILEGVRADITVYTDEVIKKRLGVPMEKTLQIDLDNEKAVLNEQQDK